MDGEGVVRGWSLWFPHSRIPQPILRRPGGFLPGPLFGSDVVHFRATSLCSNHQGRPRFYSCWPTTNALSFPGEKAKCDFPARSSSLQPLPCARPTASASLLLPFSPKQRQPEQKGKASFCMVDARPTSHHVEASRQSRLCRCPLCRNRESFGWQPHANSVWGCTSPSQPQRRRTPVGHSSESPLGPGRATESRLQEWHPPAPTVCGLRPQLTIIQQRWTDPQKSQTGAPVEIPCLAHFGARIDQGRNSSLQTSRWFWRGGIVRQDA